MVGHAVERARKEGAGMRIVAVTVLTSLDDADLRTVGVEAGIRVQVERLARMAWQEGVRDFVCSPLEATALRGLLGPEATLITPGVRAAGDRSSDQKRTLSAGDAVHAGAFLGGRRPPGSATPPIRARRRKEIAREVDAARSRS